MDFLKRHPLFITIAVVCLLAFVGELVYAFLLQGQVKQAAEDVETSELRLRNLARSEPAPTRTNLDLAVANREALKAQYDAFVAELTSSGNIRVPLESPYEEPQNMYFDIINFIEERKAEATGRAVTDDDGNIVPCSEIDLGPNPTLGFASFIESGQGPSREEIDEIYRQRVIIGYLLRELFAAKTEDAFPLIVEGVKREPVRARRKEFQPGQSTQNNPDLFIVNPQITAAVPGAIKTTGFQITFVSRTDVLREFMKQLAAFEIPVVVRSVEVERSTMTPCEDGSIAESDDDQLAALFGADESTTVERQARIDLVSTNVSKFTVTIEYIEVVSDQEGEGA